MASDREQMKQLVDRLSDEDIMLVLPLVRSLVHRYRTAEDAQTEDRQDIEDALRALAEPGSTPWDEFKANRGLSWTFIG